MSWCPRTLKIYMEFDWMMCLLSAHCSSSFCINPGRLRANDKFIHSNVFVPVRSCWHWEAVILNVCSCSCLHSADSSKQTSAAPISEEKLFCQLAVLHEMTNGTYRHCPFPSRFDRLHSTKLNFNENAECMWPRPVTCAWAAAIRKNVDKDSTQLSSYWELTILT